MPEIKLQHVVSCSSEDKNNPASNLLKPDGTHKWRSASSGEKQLSVVLQFEKASQIQSIDIGNDGSAFVEILVGKSTASTDQDYQVILVASTFMNPMESRNGNNRNVVRMFGPDKLTKPVCGQNWDRVKIVCTQPFNKNTAYGLSFIRFHSPSDGKDETPKPIKKLGAFTIKSEDEDNIKAGTLFAGRSKEKSETTTPMKPAAAIRAAAKLVEETKSPSTIERKVASSSSSSSSSSSTSSTPKPKPKPSSTTPKRKHEEDDDDTATAKPPLRKQSTSISSVSSTKSNEQKPPPLKKVKSEPAKERPGKEFGRLMEKVVFVMSGYQNPYRGELRDKALEMGATYKPDWGRGCTHLVCAFANTPKYNQVKGKGKIVTHKFITDSYKEKKLVHWRKYRVGDAGTPEGSSDEEEVAEVTKTPQKTPTPKKSPKQKKAEHTEWDSEEEDMYGGETESAEDTDDEIERAKVKIEAQKLKKEEKDSSTQKQVKTETMDEDSNDSGLPELPDFFCEKKFFLYGVFSEQEKRLMRRYITAYNGELMDYMSNDVTYVLTNSKWDDNFDDALSENNKLIFVKPKWIHLCHEKMKCLPHQPYVVVPA